jgi:hypothetical protein
MPVNRAESSVRAGTEADMQNLKLLPVCSGVLSRLMFSSTFRSVTRKTHLAQKALQEYVEGDRGLERQPANREKARSHTEKHGF